MPPKKILSKIIISPITTTNTYSTLCDDLDENNEIIEKLTRKIEELLKKLTDQNNQIIDQNKQIEKQKQQIKDYESQIAHSSNFNHDNSFIQNSESDADKLERELMEIYSDSNIMNEFDKVDRKVQDEKNQNEKVQNEKVQNEKNQNDLEIDTNEWKQYLKTYKSVNIKFLKKGTYGDKLIKPEHLNKIKFLLISENDQFTENDIFIITEALKIAASHNFNNHKIDNDKDLHKICTVGTITCLCNILFKTRDETIKFRKQLREHFQWFINDPNAQIDHSMLKSHSLGPYEGETNFLKKLYKYMLSEGLDKITDAYCKKPIY